MLITCLVRRLSVVVSLLIVLTLTGCSTPLERTVTAIPAITEKTVTKSPTDTRDYRYLKLANGLKVLLISDPKTDKAAAAVAVQVGSHHDPEQRLGLAHFLEHMLFLGNNKYPAVDGYFEYIRANGGSANAYTANTHTNYFFDINSDKLQPALDQLAQFFIAPTLDPQYVDRERRAVDAEYRLHTREDGWRIETALDATANPKHPKSRFTIGNLDTLNNADGQSLWQDLKAFYDRYYVASNMAVVVYGKDSTDTLAQWATDAFANVPLRQSPSTAIGITPYTANERGVRINVVPLKDTRMLSLQFPLESVHPYYAKKPLAYLARLVGHEGQGSLHSLLKAQGLIDSLSAYSHDVPNEYSEFVVQMELTKTGLAQVDDITASVFDYLDLIRQQGVQAWLYQEYQQIAALDFQFQERQRPQKTVSMLATRMHHLPAAHILNVNALYEQYDPALIQRFLTHLTPDNLRQVVVAQGLATNKTEPYFQTQYRVQPLSQALVKRLRTPKARTHLAMPTANPFIAHDIALRQAAPSSDLSRPMLIEQKPGLDVWHMTDTHFAIPKANVHIKLSTAKASDLPDNAVCLQLYRALLSRHLNKYGYPATEAGLYYAITADREGLTINLSGYQDKQDVLLQAILAGIQRFKLEPATFEQERAQLIRYLNNKAFLPPYRLAIEAVDQVMYPRHFNDATLLQAAQSISAESVTQYAKQFFSALHVTLLIHGNYSRQEATTLAKQVEQAILTADNRTTQYHEPYHRLADQQQTVELASKHSDAVFVAYHQRSETNNRERARYALLGKLLDTPFFNTLRTEQQLGYVVFAGARPLEKHPGIIFVVQSPALGPQGIEARVATFLKQQVPHLDHLPAQELEQYRQGLIGDLLKQDANLDERSARFWQNIDDHEPFDNRQAIADEIRTLTLADMQQALATLIAGKGRLVVRSVGKGKKQQQAANVQQEAAVL